MAVLTFQDKELEAFVNDRRKAGNRFRKYARDGVFYDRLLQAVQILYSVASTDELKPPYTVYSFLKYERLKYMGEDVSSVRVMNGRVERLLFREMNNGIEIIILELNNTHYGNKK